MRLTTSDKSFAASFLELLGQKRESSAQVDTAVAEIIASVRADGDKALIELSKKFDVVDLEKLGLSGHGCRGQGGCRQLFG